VQPEKREKENKTANVFFVYTLQKYGSRLIAYADSLLSDYKVYV
jgi:hypothetical protein